MTDEAEHSVDEGPSKQFSLGGSPSTTVLVPASACVAVTVQGTDD